MLRYGYDLGYDEIGAALGSTEAGGTAGGLRRRAPAAKGAAMTESPPPSTSASARPRPRTDLLDVAFDVVRRHADRAAARRRHRPRRLPDQLRRRAGAPPRSARAPFGPRVLRSSKPVERVRRELDEYFAGRRQHFDVEPDVRVPAGVQPASCSSELARVEYGTTTTYGTLAALTGNPRAARAVGTVMNRNPIPIVLPCHRVIGASGSLTGYARRARPQGAAAPARGRDPLARYGRTP